MLACVHFVLAFGHLQKLAVWFYTVLGSCSLVRRSQWKIFSHCTIYCYNLCLFACLFVANVSFISHLADTAGMSAKQHKTSQHLLFLRYKTTCFALAFHIFYLHLLWFCGCYKPFLQSWEVWSFWVFLRSLSTQPGFQVTLCSHVLSSSNSTEFYWIFAENWASFSLPVRLYILVFFSTVGSFCNSSSRWSMTKFLHCRNFAHSTGAKRLVGFDSVFLVNFTFVMLRSFCRYFA